MRITEHPDRVTHEQLCIARDRMRRGWTLVNAALDAKVWPNAMDLALWRDLGMPKRPEPMF